MNATLFVYSLTCVPTGHVYVGATTDPETRERTHRCCLRRGNHSNTRLRRLSRRYKESEFEWEVLHEAIVESELEACEIETEWCKMMSKKRGKRCVSDPRRILQTQFVITPMRRAKIAVDQFAKLIFDHRKAAGMTQAQLAEAVEMSPSSISEYENGVRNPSWETVLAIAFALGVSTEAFYWHRGKS